MSSLIRFWGILQYDREQIYVTFFICEGKMDSIFPAKLHLFSYAVLFNYLTDTICFACFGNQSSLPNSIIKVTYPCSF